MASRHRSRRFRTQVPPARKLRISRTAVAPNTRKQTRTPGGKRGNTIRPAMARLANRNCTSTSVRCTLSPPRAGADLICGGVRDLPSGSCDALDPGGALFPFYEGEHGPGAPPPPWSLHCGPALEELAACQPEWGDACRAAH